MNMKKRRHEMFVAQRGIAMIKRTIGDAAKIMIEQTLPDEKTLVAETWDDPEYPGVRVSLRVAGQPDELICFAEYNSTKPVGRELCIAAYSSGRDEPVYYESYADPGAPSPNV
jgi:hypothetical protein